MSGGVLPHQQHIGRVSAQQGSEAYVGEFNNCQFGSTNESQKTLEQAAKTCRSALFLTHPDVDRESLISAKGTRVAGTCEWIKRNDSYRAWLNGNTRLLWISGGPGKGKTMLSVFLTEELERMTASMENAQLVYYFCSQQDEKRNTAIAVLRGLVHRIITKHPQLVKHALSYFETPEGTQQTLSSLETLWIIFRKLATDPDLGTVFCVLDGLDECDEASLRVLVPKIVSLLTPQAPSVTITLRLAIVSRDIPSLRGCERVKLDPDNNEEVASDIERFISVRVEELSRIEGFSDHFRTAVQTNLLARAEGTFLWVGFAMYELSQKKTCTEVLEALNALPSGLPAIYSRMLLRIPVEWRKISRAILCWVTMALRPLKLKELAAAVDIQRHSTLITEEHAIRDAIALCGPILKIQKQYVGLVHQSAQDYLLRKEHDNNAILEAFRLMPKKSHLQLAQTCLDCVQHSGLQRMQLQLEDLSHSSESPLLPYAAVNWPEHAKGCSELAVELFRCTEPFFQEKSRLRDNWWQFYQEETFQSYEMPQLFLHLVCFLEIVPWVEVVLMKTTRRPRFYKQVDNKDKRGQTALHWATLGGNEAVVRLLIDKGANVEAKDQSGNTALHSAAWGGNEAVVRLLIDKGANIKEKGQYGMTVLHSAAWRGNEAVVRLLIDKGADVKAEDSNRKTVLHSATAQGGNEAVVRLLINKGADVKARD